MLCLEALVHIICLAAINAYDFMIYTIGMIEDFAVVFGIIIV